MSNELIATMTAVQTSVQTLRQKLNGLSDSAFAELLAVLSRPESRPGFSIQDPTKYVMPKKKVVHRANLHVTAQKPKAVKTPAKQPVAETKAAYIPAEGTAMRTMYDAIKKDFRSGTFTSADLVTKTKLNPSNIAANLSHMSRRGVVQRVGEKFLSDGRRTIQWKLA